MPRAVAKVGGVDAAACAFFSFLFSRNIAWYETCLLSCVVVVAAAASVVAFVPSVSLDLKDEGGQRTSRVSS